MLYSNNRALNYSLGVDTEQSLCAEWENLSYHRENQVLNNCVQILHSIESNINATSLILPGHIPAAAVFSIIFLSCEGSCGHLRGTEQSLLTVLLFGGCSAWTQPPYRDGWEIPRPPGEERMGRNWQSLPN